MPAKKAGFQDQITEPALPILCSLVRDFVYTFVSHQYSSGPSLPMLQMQLMSPIIRPSPAEDSWCIIFCQGLYDPGVQPWPHIYGAWFRCL